MLGIQVGGVEDDVGRGLFLLGQLLGVVNGVGEGGHGSLPGSNKNRPGCARTVHSQFDCQCAPALRAPAGSSVYGDARYVLEVFKVVLMDCAIKRRMSELDKCFKCV